MSSSYELERLKKIERNKSRLAALGLVDVKIGQKEKKATDGGDDHTDGSSNSDNTHQTPPKREKQQQLNTSPMEKRSSDRLKSKTRTTYNYSELERQKRQEEKEQKQQKNKRGGRRSSTNNSLDASTPRRRRGYTEWASKQESVGSRIELGSGRRSSERLKKKRRKDYSQFDISFSEKLTDSWTKSENQNPIIMFTQEVEAMDEYDTYLDILDSLEGSIEVEDVSKITHLISTQYKRTVKHLCAIGVCAKVMHPDWILASRSFGAWVEESPFLLEGPAEVEEALARSLEHNLFENHTFFITENVAPKRDLMSKIITCNGGTVIADLSSEERTKVTNDELHIISSQQDLQYIRDNILNDSELARIARIHESEFVIHSVYTQQVDWNSHLLDTRAEASVEHREDESASPNQQ